MSSHYAQDTKVPIERSQGEIRTMLLKRGAVNLGFAEKAERFVLAFTMHNRQVVFAVKLPARPNDKATQASIKTYEQLCRAKWRALVLCLKAKFVTVESGVTSFEDEFLAHIALPNGNTVGTEMKEHIEYAYTQGKMPDLLQLGGGQ